MRRRLTPLLVATVSFGFVTSASPAPAASSEVERAEAPDPSGNQGIRIRRDVQDLTAHERGEFVAAVKALKRRCSPYESGRDFLRPAGTPPCLLADGTASPTGISWYDQFVLWHRMLSECDPVARYHMNGHNGPLFLPWHRQFLLMFEDALREVSGRNITVPYWDTTNDESTRATFADDFMGGDGDSSNGWALMTGPFKSEDWNNFPVRNQGLFWGPSDSGHITRRMGFLGEQKKVKAPPTKPASIEAALGTKQFDTPPYDDSSDDTQSFRNALEGWVGDRTSRDANGLPDPAGRPQNPFDAGPSRGYCAPDGWVVVPMRRNMTHNAAHSYIGGVIGATPTGANVFGTMAAVPTSPNDPVFFLLHSNVDRLWALWQERMGDVPEARFPQDSPNPWDDATAKMTPFADDGSGMSPSDVENIEELRYRYEEPRWTRSLPRTRESPTTSRRADSSTSPFYCKIHGRKSLARLLH